MLMRPACYNCKLYETGENCRDCRADTAKLRRAEFAENQDIVKHQIDKHRDDAGNHRNDRFSGFTQRARIGQSKGQNSDDDHFKVSLPIRARRLKISDTFALMDKLLDQRFSHSQKNNRENCR